ncbi:MAG: DMT family transporter [Lautropia sp.]
MTRTPEGRSGTPTRGQSVLKAAAWMGGALLSFSAMAISGRELAGELHTFQLLFFRSALGLALIAVVLSVRGLWSTVATRRLPEHLMRNAVHFGAQYAWFVAIALLPLAQVFAIEFTVPLWTLLLAWIVLREPLTRSRVLAVALGMIGVAMIVRPGARSFDAGTAIMLAGAIGFAISYLFVKRLVTSESATAIIFWMSLIQLPMALVPALAVWRWPSAATIPWILLIGVTALSAHFCASRALAEADASIVVPMDFLRLPLIAVVGAWAYAEPFDPMVIAGGALMVIGNLANLRGSRAR